MSPVSGNGSATLRKMRSPQMIGVDPDIAGIGSFQRMFSVPVADHFVGRFFSVLIPLADGPRQCGQLSSALNRNHTARDEQRDECAITHINSTDHGPRLSTKVTRHEDTSIFVSSVFVTFVLSRRPVNVYSALSAPTSGARIAALVAMTDDTSPAASTARSSSQPPAVSGSRAPRSIAAGRDATSALSAPAARPHPSRTAFSDRMMAKRCAAAVADGAQQRQLAAALEHVAQQDRGEPDGADQQPEPAKRLERREVGVLDGVELRQPLRGGHGVGAEVPGAVALDRGARPSGTPSRPGRRSSGTGSPAARERAR